MGLGICNNRPYFADAIVGRRGTAPFAPAAAKVFAWKQAAASAAVCAFVAVQRIPVAFFEVVPAAQVALVRSGVSPFDGNALVRALPRSKQNRIQRCRGVRVPCA